MKNPHQTRVSGSANASRIMDYGGNPGPDRETPPSLGRTAAAERISKSPRSPLRSSLLYLLTVATVLVTQPAHAVFVAGSCSFSAIYTNCPGTGNDGPCNGGDDPCLICQAVSGCPAGAAPSGHIVGPGILGDPSRISGSGPGGAGGLGPGGGVKGITILNAGTQYQYNQKSGTYQPSICQTCPGGNSWGGDMLLGGMPTWQVTEPLLNVWLSDKPLSYQPGRGLEIAFTLFYKEQRDSTEQPESVTPNVFSVGSGWTTPWRCYMVDKGGASQFDYYGGYGNRQYVTNSGAPTYRGQFHYVLPRTNTVGVQYESAGQDTYGLRYQDSTGVVRWFLTERRDAYGNTNTYSYITNSGTICLTNITDPDGRRTWLTYTQINSMWLVAKVTDPFGRSATLQYDSATVPNLVSITDAANISSSFGYDSNDNLNSLVTPYATNSFTPASGTDGYGHAVYAMWVHEAGVHQGTRDNLYMYYNQGDAARVPPNYASYCPTTTSFSNTFDSTNSNLRNSFFWSPLQFELLPTTFVQDLANGICDASLLAATNFLDARQRHWLQATVNGSLTLGSTLSLERAPSPDGVTQGEITWYDYDNKNSGDPTQEGTSMLPRLTAWKLPNGESSFTYYQRNGFGLPTNTIETWDDTAGTLRLRTNTFIYATNNLDLLVVTNAAGFLVTSNVYDANHHLMTNYNALNEMTVFAYDGNNRLTGITAPNGLVTTNTYGSDGYLSQTADLGYRTNNYTWANGLVATHTDERGLLLVNTSDNLNRLVKVTYPDTTYTTNIYLNLDLVETIDRMGFSNRFEYNDFRQVVHSIDALNRTNTFGYCDCGVLTSITDPANQTTSFYYDIAGRKVASVSPDGYTVNNRFDLMGRLTNVFDSAGLSTTTWFNNQALSIVVSNTIGKVLVQNYDALDRSTNSTDANGVTVGTSYDNLNRVLSRSSPDGGVEGFGYSKNIASLTSYTSQVNNVVQYGYDGEGRKTNEIYVGVTTNAFAYAPASDLIALTDGKSDTTAWEYDTYGRMTNKLDNLGANMFSYGYDADNRLTNRWTPAKGTTAYSYDNVGNLTGVNYSGGTVSMTNLVFKYDSLNRLTNMLDAIGTTVYNYDAVGQLLSDDGPWSDDMLSYTYNSRLRSSISVSVPDGSAWAVTYSYDAAKRLTNVTSAAGSFGYGYRAGQASRLPVFLSLPNGSYITNTYDSVARLSATILKTGGGTVLNSHQYTYNQANQRTQQVFTAGNYINFTYDGMGQLLTVQGAEPGGVTNRLQEQFGYTYDAAGNLIFRTNNALVQPFVVNTLNELAGGSRSGALTVAGTTTSPATNVTVNSSNAVLYLDGTFAAAGFNLTNGNNTYAAIAKDVYGRVGTNGTTVNLPATNSYSYDLNGNLLYDGNRAFDYDDENQLIRATVTNGWKSEFMYDGKLRRRIRREFAWTGSGWIQTNEVRYLYDGNLVIQERDTNNLPSVTYTRGNDFSQSLQGAGGIGGLLARTDNHALVSGNSQAHAFYHADGNGNLTALINSSNTFVAKYEYDAYGNIISESGSLANANLYRFSSKEFHVASGLVYYLYRYYEPNLQRWLIRDPLTEGGFEALRTTGPPVVGANPFHIPGKYRDAEAELYLQVGNDPINRLDALGLKDYGFIITCAMHAFKSALPGNEFVDALTVMDGCNCVGLALNWAQRQKNDCEYWAMEQPSGYQGAAEAACYVHWDPIIHFLQRLYDKECKG